MTGLARYALTSRIHESATTVLYRGIREADRAPVVVKCLKNEFPRLGELLKLRHEYAILREVAAPGVVRAFALERHGNGLALVMEDLGGQTLHALMRRRRLRLRTALDLAAGIADALAAIHQQGVIHKDVKPHNILVDPERRRVVLIDFELATRLSHETPGDGSPAALEGTLAYMSPEQTGRMNRVVDHRSDLYSLGVTLYEMLTGVLPFQATEPMDLVHSHIARRPTPPHEIAPEVPEAVSAIVMRLLAKAAEDRYQHAVGLRADLEEALARLRLDGTLEPFPLGRYDLSAELRMPQRLYGRDAELGALLGAFERACAGSAELLLVAGYAGVGKSVLVHEVRKPIARRNGFFIHGKFDQFSRSVPFAPVARAFRDLVQQISAGSATEVARWRGALRAALGANAAVLVDLIPELEALLGPQPTAQPLGPTESQNRFALVFQNFLRVFTSAEHPLVVFLDDLQWADPGSLRLLQLLLTGPESGHLLVIGAYRDNEVGASHPLALGLEELRQPGARVSTIALAPLELAHVAALTADALGCEPRRVAALAECVHARTHGNPFFVTQALRTLYQDRLLRFDPEVGAWTWDLDGARAALPADDVGQLLADKLGRLAPATQRVLQLAACIGFRFDLTTLAVIHEASPARTAADLWEALREGLVLPLDPSCRFVHTGADGADDEPAAELGFEVAYRFLHDRAQQAAYALVSPERRPELHLRIGRLIRARSGDDELFDVVNHLNQGAACIEAPAERLDLAALNLACGRRAKAATAYAAAAGYLAAGMSLLPAASWDECYELTFALHFERAECEHLVRNADTAEALFAALLARARTRVEQARIHDLHVNLLTTLGRIPDAMRIGAAALALFDIALPETESARRAELAAELAAVPTNLAGRRIADLADGPALTDPDQQAVQALVTSLLPTSFLTDPTLYATMIVKHVNLSLRYGNSPVSAMGYVSYSYFLAGVLGRVPEAVAFGRLALELVERYGNADLRCKVHFIVGCTSHFHEPLYAGLEGLERARQFGLETGDFQYLSYSTYCTFMYRLALGEDLGSVREEVDRFLALMQRTRDALSTQFLLASRQVVANLEGRTRARDTLSDEQFDEDAFEAMLEQTGLIFVGCYYHTYRLQLAFLRGDHARALALGRKAEAIVGSAAGLYFTTELVFYLALTLAALQPAADPAERAGLAEELARHRAQLAAWAAHAPFTYEHKRLLVEAETARVERRDADAMALYDRAIEAARASEFVGDEALANELCARFYASSGRARIARAYATDAYYCHLRWGAAGRVRDLEEAFPHLREVRAAAAFGPALTVTRAVGAHLLDTATVVQAAQAIASELELERALERLMRIVIEAAGAQRAALLLARDGGLRVEATITVDPDEVRVGVGVPLEAADDLARTAVQHVARTRQPLVVGDAARDPALAVDRYVVARQPRSLSCVPMVHQGRLTGVLYLENNVVHDAFTPARTELLQVLSTQAAIAIENALLYASVRDATAQLRAANEGLERQIAERTAALQRAMTELWSEMDLARKIQTVLLPTAPAVAGCDVAAAMRPATHVGGDYYDAFRAGGRDWVLIGDVSGHGVPAGLIMMMVQTAVRAAVRAFEDAGTALTPSRVLAAVNGAIRGNLEKIGRGQYMTIAALAVGDGAVCYAGMHEDLLVYRAAERRVEQVATRGVWLGVLDEIGALLEDRELRLGPGDVLLLVTDGVTEARRDGRMLGTGGVAALLADAAARCESSRALVDALLAGLEGCAVDDDVTVLAVRRPAGTGA